MPEPTDAYQTPRWPKPGTLVRPLHRGKHHVLATAYVNGRWVGHTLCGRYVDRSTWQGPNGVRWAPEDGCRACGFTSHSADSVAVDDASGGGS